MKPIIWKTPYLKYKRNSARFTRGKIIFSIIGRQMYF